MLPKTPYHLELSLGNVNGGGGAIATERRGGPRKGGGEGGEGGKAGTAEAWSSRLMGTRWAQVEEGSVGARARGPGDARGKRL